MLTYRRNCLHISRHGLRQIFHMGFWQFLKGADSDLDSNLLERVDLKIWTVMDLPTTVHDFTVSWSVHDFMWNLTSLILPFCQKWAMSTLWVGNGHFYRPRSLVCPSVRVFACLFVGALLFEPFDLRPWFFVKVKGKFKMSFFYWRGVVDNGTWLCQVQQKVQWNTN